MKKLQIIAFTILFAFIGIELSMYAADGCAKGWRKKNGVCKKVSAKQKVAAAHKSAAKKTTDQFKLEQIARNAMLAYNIAISKSSQNSSAAQTAALNAINNVIAMYNTYGSAIQNGTPVVFGGNSFSAPSMSGAPRPGFAAAASKPVNAYVSSCGDGSTATCMFDGTEIVGIDCGDGTKSDKNGMCSDGSLVTCDDGSQPLCGDYTSPY